PLFTASSNWKAGTTAPAGSTSIFSRLPAMSLTFLAKSCAYSWKMSFAGQVDWKRKLAVCARETPGAASAPAVAAPAAAFFRKRRRGAVVFEASVMGPVSFGASKAGAHHHGVPGGAATIRLPPDRRYW